MVSSLLRFLSYKLTQWLVRSYDFYPINSLVRFAHSFVYRKFSQLVHKNRTR